MLIIYHVHDVFVWRFIAIVFLTLSNKPLIRKSKMDSLTPCGNDGVSHALENL